MKKIFNLAGSLLVAVVGISACSTESTSEYHQTSFYPMNATGRMLYADQTKDTLFVLSYDSWKAEELFGQSERWFTMSPKQQNVPAGYFSKQPIAIETTPNTSGAERVGAIKVTPATEKLSSIGMPIIQNEYLNILRPAAATDKNKKVVFAEALPATATTTHLVFTLYDTNSASHSATTDAEWLHLEIPAAGLPVGKNELKIRVDANTQAEKRTGKVVLTSAGVSTTVSYIQNGTK